MTFWIMTIAAFHQKATSSYKLTSKCHNKSKNLVILNGMSKSTLLILQYINDYQEKTLRDIFLKGSTFVLSEICFAIILIYMQSIIRVVTIIWKYLQHFKNLANRDPLSRQEFQICTTAVYAMHCTYLMRIVGNIAV